jgi:hypothetical protein
MFNRNNYSSLNSKVNRNQYLNQDFVIYHPFFEAMMERKMQISIKHGNLTNLVHKNLRNNSNNAMFIEAPCIMGNSKKIEIRVQTVRRNGSYNQNSVRNNLRPKTTNTVIRSRTS